MKHKNLNDLLKALRKAKFRMEQKRKGIMIYPPEGIDADPYMLRWDKNHEGKGPKAYHQLRRYAKSLGV